MIRADEPREVKADVTDERKDAVLRLVENTINVEDGMILLKAPKQLHHLQELEFFLEEMRAAARILDIRR